MGGEGVFGSDVFGGVFGNGAGGGLSVSGSGSGVSVTGPGGKPLVIPPEVQEQLNAIAARFAEIWKTLSAVLLVLLLIGGILAIVGYLLRSIALAKIAHRRGIPLWGLAWIPGLRLITLGAIADLHDGMTIRRRHGLRYLLPILLLIVILCAMFRGTAIYRAFTANPNDVLRVVLSTGMTATLLSILSGVCLALLSIFKKIALYKLIESCRKRHTVLDMILCLVIPFAEPIVLIGISGSDADRRRRHHHHTPSGEETFDDTEE